MPPDPVRLSVALVTRNRPDRLDRVLTSLRSQTAHPWEVVVSDDSDAAASAAVAEIAARHDCRYVEGPRQGLYANRNRAAVACSGTHIRTLDDDHELPPGHVSACLEALQDDPAAVWVIGEWVPGRPFAEPVPVPGALHPRGFIVSADGELSAIADGSTIFPRRVFDSGHRYAEEFAFGPVYLELAERLVHEGYRIRRLTTTYVIHHSIDSALTDDESEEAARMYAMLCHSFLYRPSARDRTLTAAELVRSIAAGRRRHARAFRRALAAYRKRRAAIQP